MLEANINALWGGKQVAKGTPLVAPPHRFNWVAGDFAMPREDGEEPYSDLSKFGDRSDWVNTLLGNGEPAVEATPTELAWLLWMFHGAETVTPVTGPPAVQKHTTTPQAGRGHWGTFATRKGLSIVDRKRFADSLIGRLQIEGSTANKAVRATARILSLDPGELLAADPAAAMPVENTLLYTDGAGTFTIDTVVIRGQSQFTFVADEDLSPVYGDDTVPHDLVTGSPAVTIGVTVYADADGVAAYNKQVYGSAAPAAGTKPLKRLPALGSYEFSLTQRDPTTGALNGLGFDLLIPGVKWTPGEFPGPNQGGGATEISLAGSMRVLPATPGYTLDVFTPNAVVAFTS
jgi:hypothetical protein